MSRLRILIFEVWGSISTMAKESGLRQLTRALAARAMQLSNEINRTPRGGNYQQVVHVYNSLCVVLNYLNSELKTEPLIDGISGPIPVTWEKK